MADLADGEEGLLQTKLAHVARKSGISGKLKSELRFRLIESLHTKKEGSVLLAGDSVGGRHVADPAGERAFAPLERALFSLVLEFLKARGKHYSHSVLLPECGLTTGEVLSPGEVLEALSLQHLSPMTAALGGACLLEQLARLLQKLQPARCSRAAQTEEDSERLAEQQRRQRPEERLLAIQARLEARCRREAEAELQRARALERERATLEEAAKCRTQLQEAASRAEREVREKQRRLDTQQRAALERLRARELELERHGLEMRAEAQRLTEEAQQKRLLFSQEADLAEEQVKVKMLAVEQEEQRLREREEQLQVKDTTLQSNLSARKAKFEAEVKHSFISEQESLQQWQVELRKREMSLDQERRNQEALEEKMCIEEERTARVHAEAKCEERRCNSFRTELEDSRRQLTIADRESNLASTRLRNELSSLEQELQVSQDELRSAKHAADAQQTTTTRANAAHAAQVQDLQCEKVRLVKEIEHLQNVIKARQAEREQGEANFRSSLERVWELERSGLQNEVARTRQRHSSTEEAEARLQQELSCSERQASLLRREAEELRLSLVSQEEELRRAMRRTQTAEEAEATALQQAADAKAAAPQLAAQHAQLLALLSEAAVRPPTQPNTRSAALADEDDVERMAAGEEGTRRKAAAKLQAVPRPSRGGMRDGPAQEKEPATLPKAEAILDPETLQAVEGLEELLLEAELEDELSPGEAAPLRQSTTRRLEAEAHELDSEISAFVSCAGAPGKWRVPHDDQAHQGGATVREQQVSAAPALPALAPHHESEAGAEELEAAAKPRAEPPALQSPKIQVPVQSGVLQAAQLPKADYDAGPRFMTEAEVQQPPLPSHGGSEICREAKQTSVAGVGNISLKATAPSSPEMMVKAVSTVITDPAVPVETAKPTMDSGDPAAADALSHDSRESCWHAAVEPDKPEPHKTSLPENEAQLPSTSDASAGGQPEPPVVAPDTSDISGRATPDGACSAQALPTIIAEREQFSAPGTGDSGCIGTMESAAALPSMKADDEQNTLCPGEDVGQVPKEPLLGDDVRSISAASMESRPQVSVAAGVRNEEDIASLRSASQHSAGRSQAPALAVPARDENLESLRSGEEERAPAGPSPTRSPGPPVEISTGRRVDDGGLASLLGSSGSSPSGASAAQKSPHDTPQSPSHSGGEQSGLHRDPVENAGSVRSFRSGSSHALRRSNDQLAGSSAPVLSPARSTGNVRRAVDHGGVASLLGSSRSTPSESSRRTAHQPTSPSHTASDRSGHAEAGVKGSRGGSVVRSMSGSASPPQGSRARSLSKSPSASSTSFQKAALSRSSRDDKSPPGEAAASEGSRSGGSRPMPFSPGSGSSKASGRSEVRQGKAEGRSQSPRSEGSGSQREPVAAFSHDAVSTDSNKPAPAALGGSIKSDASQQDLDSPASGSGSPARSASGQEKEEPKVVSMGDRFQQAMAERMQDRTRSVVETAPAPVQDVSEDEDEAELSGHESFPESGSDNSDAWA